MSFRTEIQNKKVKMHQKKPMGECWKGVRVKGKSDERRQRSDKKKLKSMKTSMRKRVAFKRVKDVSLTPITNTRLNFKENDNTFEKKYTVQAGEQQTLQLKKNKTTAFSPIVPKPVSPKHKPCTPRLTTPSPTTITIASKQAFASSHESMQLGSPRIPRLSPTSASSKKKIGSYHTTEQIDSRTPRLSPHANLNARKKSLIGSPRGILKCGTPRLNPTAPKKAFVNSRDILQLDPIQTKLPCVAAAESIQPIPKSSKKKKKRVRFATDVKAWDGMRLENSILQEVVLEFWQATPAISVLKSLHDRCEEHTLRGLYNAVDAVIKRVERDPEFNSPLLPEGGGQGIKFNGQHVPKLRAFLTVIACVHTKVVRAITLQLQRDMERSHTKNTERSKDRKSVV